MYSTIPQTVYGSDVSEGTLHSMIIVTNDRLRRDVMKVCINLSMV